MAQSVGSMKIRHFLYILALIVYKYFIFMKMTKCAVLGCKYNGLHKFPKNKKNKCLWIKAIRRPGLKNDSFSMRLCGNHFTDNAYRTIKSTTGFKYQRELLKNDAVPSIFPWSKAPPPYAAAREERLRTRNINKKLFPPSCSSSRNEEIRTPSLLLSQSPNSSQNHLNYNNSRICNQSTQTPVLLRLFATEELVLDDDAVKFYTGLETYQKFQFVFSTLCPMAYDLNYRSGKVISLNVEDQFLMTLIKLRCNKCDFELSKMFGISKFVVSNVFITWLHFMYGSHIWSLIDLWPSRDLVQYYMPDDFEKYPNTRLIIDTTEIPICKPSNPIAQQVTFSTYKNKNTIKFLIAATPGGIITYCSDGYGGATSDRQLIERSPLLDLCEPGDVIMANRGFNVQDIFAPKDFTITIPTFLKGMSQLPGIKLRNDRVVKEKSSY